MCKIKMKNTKWIRLIFVVFLVLFTIQLAGCNKIRIGNPLSKTNVPGSSVPNGDFPEDMNKSIRLMPDPILKSEMSINSIINLVVENQTNKDIWFPTGCGIKIFQRNAQNTSWDEIQDKIENSGEPYLIIVPKGQGLYDIPINVFPIVTAQNREVYVRVYVFGEFYENGKRTGIPVGAYTDLTLAP
jgi:hypothetical protein